MPGAKPASQNRSDVGRRRGPLAAAALAALGLLCALPSQAMAASPVLDAVAAASAQVERLRYVVFITFCLALGYVVVHVIDRRIPQLRVLVAGGLEYILIGIALRQLHVVDANTVAALSPVISFGIGSVGLLIGIQLRPDRQPTINADAVRGSLLTSLFTAGLIVGVFYLWIFGGEWLDLAQIRQLYGSEQVAVDIAHTTSPTTHGGSALEVAFEPGTALTWHQDLVVGAMVLAASAIISTTDLIERVIRERRPTVGFMSRVLFNTAWLSELIGVVVFGLVFGAVHLGETSFRQPTVPEWFFINIGLGLALGLIFAAFIGKETQDEERFFVAALGIIVFSSGLAYYLNISPLLVNMMTGIVLARTAAAKMLNDRLATIEKPGFIVLFIFLGFAWEPPPLWGWVLVPLYLGARILGKGIGSYLTYYYSERQSGFGHGMGLALAAQGGIVAAIALNYHQVYQTPLTASLVNCMVVAVLANEWFGRRGIRTVLVNSRELELGIGRHDHGVPLPMGTHIDWGVDEERERERERRAAAATGQPLPDAPRPRGAQDADDGADADDTGDDPITMSDEVMASQAAIAAEPSWFEEPDEAAHAPHAPDQPPSDVSESREIVLREIDPELDPGLDPSLVTTSADKPTSSAADDAPGDEGPAMSGTVDVTRRGSAPPDFDLGTLSNGEGQPTAADDTEDEPDDPVDDPEDDARDDDDDDDEEGA